MELYKLSKRYSAIKYYIYFMSVIFVIMSIHKFSTISSKPEENLLVLDLEPTASEIRASISLENQAEGYQRSIITSTKYSFIGI